jgi:hypothetical protein
MFDPVADSRNRDVESWGLQDWNTSLFRHFFTSRDSASDVLRLYVTAEELRNVSGAETSSADHVRHAFIDSLKRAIDGRSLGLDADIRAQLWKPKSPVVPPFLSHLLLTCMVANDLADELQSTGDFRRRLSQVLGGGTNHGLERLRPLWERLSDWLFLRNTQDARCRMLRLPLIPEAGRRFSIIGYSLRLAIPSRRDQSILFTAFSKEGLIGKEPTIEEVVRIAECNSRRLSERFVELFQEFLSGLKTLPRSALFQSTFWLAARDIALSGPTTPVSDSGFKTRLELEDDEGRFWLYLTCDREIHCEAFRTVPLPTARSSPYRFVIVEEGEPSPNSLIERVLVNAPIAPALADLLKPLKQAAAEGILLFAEDDDGVYITQQNLPSGGELCALVGDKLSLPLKNALQSVGSRPDVVKSRYRGWFEWRDVGADAFLRADFSRSPVLSGARCLRHTLTPPALHVRGGLRVGDSYLGVSAFLPEIVIPDADSVVLQSESGSLIDLTAMSAEEGSWTFPAGVASEKLLGRHHLIAFSNRVRIAEKKIAFTGAVFGTHYKEAAADGRWITEAGIADTVVYRADVVVPWSTGGSQHFSSSSAPHLGVKPRSRNERLDDLLTIIAAQSVSQSGIPEQSAAAIMIRTLGLSWGSVWPVLRAWVENGILDCLTDLRWRARLYLARPPCMVVCGSPGDFHGVITGLAPPLLLQRFRRLVDTLHLEYVERGSPCEYVPPMPACRASSLDRLAELASETGLDAPAWLMHPKTLAKSVLEIVATQSPEPKNWPVYRRWDWEPHAFVENPSNPTLSEVSIEWCRRDDGPDCYKVYESGTLRWWTRSRTWAVLAAYTSARKEVFERPRSGVAASRGDSGYVPLPLARFAAIVGPVAPGPRFSHESRSMVYEYTFPDDALREAALDILWPSSGLKTPELPPRIKKLLGLIPGMQGPVIPIPAALKRSLALFSECAELKSAKFVPISLLPQLYAALRGSGGAA